MKFAYVTQSKDMVNVNIYRNPMKLEYCRCCGQAINDTLGLAILPAGVIIIEADNLDQAVKTLSLLITHVNTTATKQIREEGVLNERFVPLA